MNPSTALLVIDPQLDYFPNGLFPLWNTATVKANLLTAIAACHNRQMPVVLIQHLADSELAPFFKPGTPGAAIDPDIRQAAPEAPVVIKHAADAFHHTELDDTLQRLGVEKILLSGMMTQNCVTFTALSRTAEKYEPAILSDCCTTVSEMLHRIALNALSIRVPLVTLAVLRNP